MIKNNQFRPTFGDIVSGHQTLLGSVLSLLMYYILYIGCKSVILLFQKTSAFTLWIIMHHSHIFVFHNIFVLSQDQQTPHIYHLEREGYLFTNKKTSFSHKSTHMTTITRCIVWKRTRSVDAVESGGMLSERSTMSDLSSCLFMWRTSRLFTRILQCVSKPQELHHERINILDRHVASRWKDISECLRNELLLTRPVSQILLKMGVLECDETQ